MELAEIALSLMRLVVFALALGITVISFQAYRQHPTPRLESAFTGFAFISMGIALSTLRPQGGDFVTVFEIVETIPYIIGFASLYVSLYR